MSSSRNCAVCTIIPPYILQRLAEHPDPQVRNSARNTLLTTTLLRGQREVRSQLAISAAAQGDGRRTIFDCNHGTDLSSASLARSENGPASSDDSVNEAYDGFGKTRDFYKAVFNRNSIDDHGLRLNGYVHYDNDYQNAFWDGSVMVFGDGDGVVFSSFTDSIDVIAHELTHGVTERTAGLEYHKQPGALNESMSDVFGSLVKQWSLGQDAAGADWLIGAEVFTPATPGDALRSMKAPGTAFKDVPGFGSDPQPDHMNKFVHLPDNQFNDWGGVHYNSGIPNKAFYLVATRIGGKAWEAPGHIWYQSLLASTSTTDFQDFADMTHMQAGRLYGTGSDEQHAVQSAWSDVGVRISGAPAVTRRLHGRAEAINGHAEELTHKVESLATQVKVLTRELKVLKSRAKERV